jgi:voltage-gated potassium channel
MNPLSRSPFRNLLFGVLYVIIVSALATMAYVLNGWSVGDAVYMVVLTVFTVGFEEVHPIDTEALRAITITLIVTGCTGMLFLTGALVQFITLSQIQLVLGLKRMNRQIESLRNHVIICGFGRVGGMLATELRAGKAEFVIIEQSSERCADMRERGFLCMQADATDEVVLEEAGVYHARALASMVPSDAVNVFITLSARGLNPSLQIIARAESPATEKKLLQAGANAVVMPAHIGAEQVASMILFPAMSSAILLSERRRQMELDLRTLGLEIEEVVVAEGSAFAGLTVAEIEEQAERHFFIVAIEKAGSGKAEPPLANTRLLPGDGVTLLGRSGRGAAVSKFAEPV